MVLGKPQVYILYLFSFFNLHCEFSRKTCTQNFSGATAAGKVPGSLVVRKLRKPTQPLTYAYIYTTLQTLHPRTCTIALKHGQRHI